MIFFGIFLIVSYFNREIFASGMNTSIPNNNQNKTLKAIQLFELIVSPDKIPLSEEERNNLVIEISTRLINGTHNISTTNIKPFAPKKIVEEDDKYKIPDFALDARSKLKTLKEEIIDKENTDNDTISAENYLTRISETPIRGENEEDIVPSTRMGGQNEDTETLDEKKLNGEKVKNNKTTTGKEKKVSTEAISARMGDINVEDLVAQKKKDHIMEKDILEDTTINNSTNDLTASNAEDFLAKEHAHNIEDIKSRKNEYDMSLEEDILEDTTIATNIIDIKASNVAEEKNKEVGDKHFIRIGNPYEYDIGKEKAHVTNDTKSDKNENNMTSDDISKKNKEKSSDKLAIGSSNNDTLMAKGRIHDLVSSGTDEGNFKDSKADKNENDMKSAGIGGENKDDKPSVLIKNVTDMRSTSISIENRIKTTEEFLTRIRDLIFKQKAQNKLSSDDPASSRTGVNKLYDAKENATRSASIDGNNNIKTSNKPSLLIKNETDIRSTSIENKVKTKDEPLTRIGDLIAKERAHNVVLSDNLTSLRTGIDRSEDTTANDTRSASIDKQNKHETGNKPFTLIKNETNMRSPSISIEDKVKASDEPLAHIGDLIAKERAHGIVFSDNLTSFRTGVGKSNSTHANDTRSASIDEENKNETSDKLSTLIKNETDMKSTNITNANKEKTINEPSTRIGDFIAKERAHNMVFSEDLISSRIGGDKSDGTKANDTRSASIDEENRGDAISNKNTSKIATSRISDLIPEVGADDRVSTRTGEDKFNSVKDNNTRSSSIDKEKNATMVVSPRIDKNKVDQPKIEDNMRSNVKNTKNQATGKKISTHMGKTNEMKDKMSSPSKGKEKLERTQDKNDMRSSGITKKNKEDIPPNGKISDAVTARIRNNFVAEKENDGVLRYTSEKVQKWGNKNNMRSEDVQPEDKQSDDKQPEDKELEDKQPEDKQPEDEQLEDEQPGDKQPKDKQPEDIQTENIQPDDKQSENNQPEDEQPGDKQPEDKQSEDIQPEDEQPGDKQPEDKQPEDIQPDAKQSEDKQPEDIQHEDKQPEDKQPDDKSPEVIQPEDKQHEDEEPEDIQPKPINIEVMQTNKEEPENAIDDRLTTYPSEVIDPFRYEFKCVSIISRETNMYIGKAILKRNSTKNVSAKKHPNFWISKWDIEYRGDTGSIKVPFLPFYWRSTATYDPMDLGPHNIIVEFDNTRDKKTNFKIEAQQKQTFKIINNDNCAFVDVDLNVKMDENCNKNNSLFYISKTSTEPCSILKGVNIRAANSSYFMTVTKAADNMEVISAKKYIETSQWDIYNYPEYSLIHSSIDSRFIWSHEVNCVKPGPIKIKTATNPLKESNKFQLDINFLNDDFYLGVTTIKVCENYVITNGHDNVILSTTNSSAVPNFLISHPDNENQIIMENVCIRVKSNNYYLGFHHSGKLEPYITLRVIPTKEMWTKWTISRRNGLYQVYAVYDERKFYWRHWQQKGKIISWEAATEETYFQLDSLTEGTIRIYEYCLYVQSLVVLSRNEYCNNREDEIFYFSIE